MGTVVLYIIEYSRCQVFLDEISGQKLAKTYKVKNKSCFNCSLYCSCYYVVDNFEAEGPDKDCCPYFYLVRGDQLAFGIRLQNQNIRIKFQILSLDPSSEPASKAFKFLLRSFPLLTISSTSLRSSYRKGTNPLPTE